MVALTAHPSLALWIGYSDSRQPGVLVWERTGTPGPYTNWQDDNSKPKSGDVGLCTLLHTSSKYWVGFVCTPTARTRGMCKKGEAVLTPEISKTHND